MRCNPLLTIVCSLITYVTGLQIVFSLDEVAFIQNLVFYIESAYCVPVSLKLSEILIVVLKYLINPVPL